MAVIVREKQPGPRWTIGNNGTLSIPYWVKYTPGSDDVADITDAVSAAAPLTVGAYVLKAIDFDPIAPDQIDATARYELASGSVTDPEEPPDPELTPPEFSLEISLATARITNSRQVISSGEADDETIPTNGTLLGVQADGTIEGIEIPQAQSTFSEVWYWPTNLLTNSYRMTLEALAGTVNFGGAFRSRAAGSVMFAGATLTTVANGVTPIRYHFQYSPPLVSFSVGDLTGINKAGWDYIEWFHKDEIASDKLKRKLIGYRIHRVFASGNFASLGIGT
jgi:hypothetical protein